MVKRQLDEKEREITLKNLAKHKKNLDILKRAEEISEFQIEKSIPFRHEQEMDMEKTNLKRIRQTMYEKELIIKVTEDQLENGIEELKEEEQDGNNETEN